MLLRMGGRKQPREDRSIFDTRAWIVLGVVGFGFFVLIARLFQLQILETKTYKLLAADQHDTQKTLTSKRGTIFFRDLSDGQLHPVAQDRDAWLVFTDHRSVKDAEREMKETAAILKIPEEELRPKFAVTTSSYVVLSKDVPLDRIALLREKHLPGIGVIKTQIRMYPEVGVGGQLLGFVSFNDRQQRIGNYGIEGGMNDVLTGEAGEIIAEKDATGRRLSIGKLTLKEARDGSDVVLTIDRTIQYEACAKIREAVRRFDAKSGSVIVMDPYTGAILAMCSAPDFEPQAYGKIKDVSVLNNPITFAQYEPGSVFKPFTMAAGLDTKKITTRSSYTDTGAESIDGFTIRNADEQAHGVQTMTQVLEKSLNTGTIFVERLLGRQTFRDYVGRFGFGEKTGVELRGEAKGDVTSLEKSGKIFGATASFGQGVSMTPLQLVTAFAALGNGGKLLRPYMVQEVRTPDGHVNVTQPTVVRQVMSPHTSELISAMLVNVVERGHGRRAGVLGYYVAGKTGTAQIPNPQGGYLEHATIGSFAGYAPAEHPRFVMLVKIDRPRTVEFAESSAAPVFGELAKFLLTYLQVPPERERKGS